MYLATRVRQGEVPDMNVQCPIQRIREWIRCGIDLRGAAQCEPERAIIILRTANPMLAMSGNGFDCCLHSFEQSIWLATAAVATLRSDQCPFDGRWSSMRDTCRTTGT
jgi:hypothetical protein